MRAAACVAVNMEETPTLVNAWIVWFIRHPFDSSSKFLKFIQIASSKSRATNSFSFVPVFDSVVFHSKKKHIPSPPSAILRRHKNTTLSSYRLILQLHVLSRTNGPFFGCCCFQLLPLVWVVHLQSTNNWLSWPLPPADRFPRYLTVLRSPVRTVSLRQPTDFQVRKPKCMSSLYTYLWCEAHVGKVGAVNRWIHTTLSAPFGRHCCSLPSSDNLLRSQMLRRRNSEFGFCPPFV